MKVMLGVSGGVDSSVAALLLKKAGVEVEGLFMQNWEDDNRHSECQADIDRRDAVSICASLGIPFHHRNFASQYWDQVFTHFLNEYRAGRTPNPDVLCNREIKFKTFLNEAQRLGADKIATGHYARVKPAKHGWQLLRGKDTNKDQSYFLYQLGQQALAKTLFPLGEIDKPQVRAMAQASHLRTFDKKDSTGICFIGERNFHHFLSQYIPAKPGNMCTPDGKVMGAHDGVMYYTLGQRGGLGIGGRANADGRPWYVVGKDVSQNILYVAQGGNNDWLNATKLRADELSWVSGEAPPEGLNITCKTRYRQLDQSCTLHMLEHGCEVHFDAPQRAITPGQSVVFYHGQVCLGGGIINTTNAAFGGWQQTSFPSTHNHIEPITA